MDILLSGMLGKMGLSILNVVKDYSDVRVVAGVDKSNEIYSGDINCYKSFNDVKTDFDVIIDFSNHSLTYDLIDFAVNENKKVVIATTGQDEREKEYIHNASKKIPIFFASNYSIGITLLIELAKKVAVEMENSDIEIVETHHSQKLDSPSGTALTIAEKIKSLKDDYNIVIGRNGIRKREKNDIGISSIRRGNIVGIHEVIISNEYETITLKHEAHTRAVFAKGALVAGKFLLDKNSGLYEMKDMILKK